MAVFALCRAGGGGLRSTAPLRFSGTDWGEAGRTIRARGLVAGVQPVRVVADDEIDTAGVGDGTQQAARVVRLPDRHC
jgi:hypothetical protein